ncbi:AAA family ATPase [Pirellulaceae bacterium SH501]
MDDLALVAKLNALLSGESNPQPRASREYQKPELGIDLSLALNDLQLPPAASQLNFDEAIEQVFECLLFGNKMPVLVGEPGVGKSTVARQLAWLLAKSDELVPRPLLGCRLVSMSRSDLMAGANKRGKTEEMAKTLVSMADRRYGKNVVFIDEIHSIFDNSKETAALAQELKPKMATGELRMIGATTRREFDEYLTVDPAMLDRIQIVNLNPPTASQTIAIIKNAKQQILGEAASANIDLDDECAQSSVKLSTEQLPLEFQPRKSIDLIKSAVARVWRTYDRNARNDPSLAPPKVGSQDIAKALGRRLGMDPAAFAFDIEAKFRNIHSSLVEKVFGHDHAIDAIVSFLQDQERGVYGDRRPRGAFLLYGPKGVGKTHFAEMLCRSYYMVPDGADLRDRFSRLDLGAMPGEMGVTAFKGASAGYVGFRATRTIYSDVRTSPNRLVLLQNIDRNIEIAPLVEEIVSDGVAIDGAGYQANFRPAIILLTSEKQTDSTRVFETICDKVLTFSPLSSADLEKVVSWEWKKRHNGNTTIPFLNEHEIKSVVENSNTPREALNALGRYLSQKKK